MPVCEKGHRMGFQAICSVCGSRISYIASLKELGELPGFDVPRESLLISFIDLPDTLVSMALSRSGSIVKLSLEDGERISENRSGLRKLRSRMWPEYYREYASRVDLLLRIYGFTAAQDVLVTLNTFSPLSVLALSSRALDPGRSVVLAIMPGESAPAPEAVNSYSSLRVINARGFQAVFISESFIGELSGYTEEWGYIDGMDALHYIAISLAGFSRDFFRPVYEDRDLGVRSYGLSSIIGGSGSVFKNTLSAMKTLLYRISMDSVPREVLSLHLYVTAPGSMLKEFEASYRDYVRSLEGVINHTLHMRERDSRLGVYDIHTIFGFREYPECEWLRRAYDGIVARNPDANVSRIIGGEDERKG